MNTLLYKPVNEPIGSRPETGKQVDQAQYYSVEFSVSGLAHQFKIWNRASTFLCILVKEGSDILTLLKVGDIMNMRYYSPDCPSQDLETKVKDMTKNDQGRFKGHYMIALEIIKNQDQPNIH